MFNHLSVTFIISVFFCLTDLILLLSMKFRGNASKFDTVQNSRDTYDLTKSFAKLLMFRKTKNKTVKQTVKNVKNVKNVRSVLTKFGIEHCIAGLDQPLKPQNLEVWKLNRRNDLEIWVSNLLSSLSFFAPRQVWQRALRKILHYALFLFSNL